ncbi:MAG: IPT/TIG domain-containing protein [Candidatus Dormibacteraeota bacterium]|nr:IPT/TIG domain-containing protein [Candidatus Dormibacteraeota bacterium]
MQSTQDVPPVAAEEIYDPGSGAWTLSGLLRQPREGATATVLPNGKVLIAGGLFESADNDSGPFDSAELFDPSAPASQGIADDLITPRGMYANHSAVPTFRAVLLSSSTTSFQTDPAVCGTNCGKVLVVGGSYDTSAELYTSSTLPPTVASVRPSTGSSLGGANVTVKGTGFTGATAVKFGSTPAQTISVIDNNTLQAISPALTPGSVEVTVAAPGGTSAACGCNSDKFTAIAPSFPTQDVVSTKQYSLANSDGSTWQALACSGGPTTCSSGGTGDAVSATLSPASDGVAELTVNADLWTQNAGFNQDIGLFVNGTLTAWKEAGGFAGTFSPNAATVQTEIPVTGGQHYNVDVRWKTNKPTTSGATIDAGTGPIGSDFSPTRLSTVLMPASAVPATATSTHQFMLSGSDGATWVPLACSGGSTTCSSAGSGGLTASLHPSSDGVAVLGFNTDLWTENAGFNQDVAVFVNGQLAGWKESGGFAGTFSPNAAFLEVRYPVSAGQAYNVDVRWKANKPDGGTIAAGAGPIGGVFSPSILSTALQPAGANPFSAVSTRQFSLRDSDGATWQPVRCSGGATTCSSSGSGDALSVTVTPNQNCTALLAGNADLWTDTAGFNQDLGIFVNGTLVGWKESGGFGGTFSPNAAFVQVAQTLNAGTSYTIDLRWKTNIAASGVGIDAGAGPSGPFSPSALVADFTSCS